ncbi:MAG: FAD-binding protein, partial [Proteobacteria bacterium]|nr:FAD-binding protein [Pseudomonadota bacterium]
MDAALHAIRSQVLAAAASGRALRIRGGGSKDFLGESLAGELLDTRPLAGLVDYQPSELVVTVRAGTPLAELEAELAARGQWLAFEPPAFGGHPTVGGAVAAGLAGPGRASTGGVRDFVLGARLLAASGELLSFGGR